MNSSGGASPAERGESGSGQVRSRNLYFSRSDQMGHEVPMKFLSGIEIQREVNRIMRSGGNVMAAVAYWSHGAAERTGIGGRRGARIICDLGSLACDPKEIRKLMGLGLQVRTLKRLHAKVWISEGAVIVGSANASRGGLSDPGVPDEKANIEAAVLSTDGNLRGEVVEWFEQIWNTRASDVSERYLKIVEARRKHMKRVVVPSEGPVEYDEWAESDLIDRAVAKANRLINEGGWDPHITRNTIQRCMEDSEWMRDYEAYVGGDVYAKGTHNSVKHVINTKLGKAILRDVGGEAVKLGKDAVRRPMENAIVGDYTVLRKKGDH